MWKMWWLSLGLAMVLLACTPEKAISPEQAVYLQLRSNEKIFASSIQIVPAVKLRNSHFVFVGYTIRPQSEQKGDRGDKSTALYEVTRTDSGWELRGGNASSYSSSPYTDVFGVHTSMGLNYADGKGTFSFAGGETAITDAVWVEVYWDDGTTQRVPVVTEHFIALRDGNSWPLRYVVLDESSNETYVRKENYDAEEIEITSDTQEQP